MSDVCLKTTEIMMWPDRGTSEPRWGGWKAQRDELTHCWLWLFGFVDDNNKSIEYGHPYRRHIEALWWYRVCWKMFLTCMISGQHRTYSLAVPLQGLAGSRSPHWPWRCTRLLRGGQSETGEHIGRWAYSSTLQVHAHTHTQESNTLINEP